VNIIEKDLITVMMGMFLAIPVRVVEVHGDVAGVDCEAGTIRGVDVA